MGLVLFVMHMDCVKSRTFDVQDILSTTEVPQKAEITILIFNSMLDCCV